MSSPSSIVGRQETSKIKLRQKFGGHTDTVNIATHLPDGQQMITCSMDGSLRVWNLTSGKQIGEDWRDGESRLWIIASSPDRKKVVGRSDDGVMRLWDIDTGKVIRKWTGHIARVWPVWWCRDDHRVISESFDRTAREWDMENGDSILGPIFFRSRMRNASQRLQWMSSPATSRPTTPLHRQQDIAYSLLGISGVRKIGCLLPIIYAFCDDRLSEVKPDGRLKPRKISPGCQIGHNMPMRSVGVNAYDHRPC
jgi:WD40 repeat protein